MAPTYKGSLKSGHPNSDTELGTRVSLQTQSIISQQKYLLWGGVPIVLLISGFILYANGTLFVYILQKLHKYIVLH